MEVHADGDLDVVLAARARVIGVNNHNIDIMVVNISITERMDHLMKEVGLISLSTYRGRWWMKRRSECTLRDRGC